MRRVLITNSRQNFLFLMMALAIMLYFSQCKKKDHFVESSTTKPPASSVPYQLLLSNEGNFGKGTASLSILKNDATDLLNDVFRTTNTRPLGDVAQSISVIGNEVYVTLNASAKIEVMSLSDFKSIATITNPLSVKNSPQYMVNINDSLAAVSDLYNKAIYILNTQKHEITRSISIPQSAQQMAKIGNYLFVNMRSSIGVIGLSNLSDLKLDNTINYGGIGTSKIVVDKNNNFWVLNSTDLVCISPITKEVVKKISLPTLSISGFGGRLELNFTQDSLFFNAQDKTTQAKGIYAVSIDDISLHTIPLFVYSDKIKTLYNMGISRNKTIYICDALDYSQRGILYEFNQKGEKITQYLTGIIPQYLYIF